MLELLRAMFLTPESQADAYSWAAVLLAHAALGAAMTGVVGAVGIRAWRAAGAVGVAYLLAWEGAQWLLLGGELLDGLTDAAAVALGAIAAAAAWGHARGVLATAAGALMAVLALGVSRRQHHPLPQDEGSPGAPTPIDTGNAQATPPAAMLDRPRALQGEANRA